MLEQLPDGVRDLLLYLIGAGIVAVFGFIGREARKIRQSVTTLNENIAVILTRLEYHEREIERHENRINDLETQKY